MTTVRLAGLRLKIVLSPVVLAALLAPPSLPGQFAFSTQAGARGQAGAADGTNSSARFDEPSAVAVAGDGTLYVADAANHIIRRIKRTGSLWTVTTLAGSPKNLGSNDGTNTIARFYYPYGIALGSEGVLYVADTYNHTVRKVASIGTNWVVTTLAGTAGASGASDGTGSGAKFNLPNGVAVDQAGNVYVTDTYNHTIRRVTQAGEVTTIAGMAGATGTTDGTNTSARFYYPSGIAVDGAGNLVIADTYNCLVRRMSPLGNEWVTSTLAGLPRFSGGADGTNRMAQFNHPFGIASAPDGTLYVADTLNDTLRAVTSAGTNWVVRTIAGLAGDAGTADGPGSSARFNLPYGLAVDSRGNLFVADTYNHSIRFGQPGFILQATQFGAQLVVSWPVGASNYVLESSGALNATAQWSPLTSDVVLSGDRFFKTNLIGGPPAFFRLHLQ